MNLFKPLFYKTLVCFSMLMLLNNAAKAEQPVLKAFASGSYQQILAKQAGQPFMLVIWSITCPACLKEMPLLNELHKQWPKFKMILLSTDGLTDTDQALTTLAKFGLTDLENWIYADDNSQKLNYEIDPEWYGELPRTYFFDAAHVRQGVSGVLSKQAYASRFNTLLKSTVQTPSQ